ncbi:MAG: RHS repeat-associated core domain-containing protein [Myxococcota bacterium]
MNQDDRLDAADALLMTRIVDGSVPETSADQARGDIAPLELAPETPSDVNAGDLVLLLRGIDGQDVDGDGVPADVELAEGASPFREDSDRDGVPDDVEILTLGSDPAQADTDQDGFGDASDPEPVQGVVFWYGDHLGSTTVRTRSDGSLLERVVYRPYGEAIAVAGGAASPPEFGYTGQRFEQGLGIYDYGARWYDPVLGRFLQPDSIVPSPTNPQSLNRYAYVLNNPISVSAQ